MVCNEAKRRRPRLVSTRSGVIRKCANQCDVKIMKRTNGDSCRWLVRSPMFHHDFWEQFHVVNFGRRLDTSQEFWSSIGTVRAKAALSSSWSRFAVGVMTFWSVSSRRQSGRDCVDVFQVYPMGVAAFGTMTQNSLVSLTAGGAYPNCDEALTAREGHLFGN